MARSRRLPLFLGSLLISGFALAAVQPAGAQTLYAIDSYDDKLYVLDPSDGTLLGGISVTVDGGNVYSGQGLATDPISGDLFAILTTDADDERRLATIDPETGVATVIANLGYPFAAITFDDAGTLYGVTGSAQFISANSRNALFTIDPSDGTLVQKCKFPGGRQGHALGFGDGLIYHAQQSGTDFLGSVILETVDPTTFPVDPVDLCTTSNIDVTVGDVAIPMHPQSLLVTGTGVGTANMLLAGWDVEFCCQPNLYGIDTSGSTGSATLRGAPSEYLKGMAYHTFSPDIEDISGMFISKISAKVREGKEKHVVYTIQVTNYGSNAIENVTLRDPLDTAKLSYVSDDSGCDLLFGYQVTCDLGTLDPSETVTVTLDTRVICKGKICQSVYNQVEASVPSDQWLTSPDQSGVFTYVVTSLKGKY